MKEHCLIVFAVLFLFSGCQGNTSNVEAMEKLRNEALTKSRNTIPVVEQFLDAFPDSNDYIYYFKVDGRTPIYSAESHFGGRFIIRLRLDVEYDYSNGDVLNYGNPSFVIEELRSVEKDANGNWRMRHGRTIKFEKDKWSEFYESNGDFSILGLEPHAFGEIEGWSDYIRQKFPQDRQ